MAYKRTTSIPVTEGGTGIATAGAAYAPLFSGTTATGAFQASSTGQATAGFVLTSTGAGSLPTWQAQAGGGGVVTIDGDSGSATGGVISLFGTANQVETTAGGATVTISVPSTFIAPGSIASTTSLTAGNAFTVTTGAITFTPLATSGYLSVNGLGVVATNATTDHALQLGNASGTLTSFTLGTAGQLVQSAGAGVDPAWTTSTYPSTTTQGDILYASANNTVAGLAKNASATRYLSNTGASNAPAWAQVNVANGVTGVLPIANGGTNTSTVPGTNDLIYFDGTRYVPLTNGITGEVLAATTGSAPSWQTFSGTVTSITGTANQITASAPTGAVTLSIPSTFIAPGSIASTTSLTAGNAFTVSAGAITFTPLATSGYLSVNGLGVVATNATTNHNVQVGNASGTLTSVAPSATSGVPLISQGAAADPVFGTAVVAGGGTGATTLTGVLIGNGTSAVTGNPITQYNTLVGGTSNMITSVAPSATSGVPLISQGAAANPAYGTAVVAGGGTGATSFTAYSVICGGTSSTGALQNVSGTGSANQVLISQGAGALPVWGNVPGSSGQITSWVYTTTHSNSLAVSTGYLAAEAGTTQLFSLPATAARGDVIAIVGSAAGFWRITQNANQIIRQGNDETTVGVGGRVTSITFYQSMEIICVETDLVWIVRSSTGSFTWV